MPNNPVDGFFRSAGSLGEKGELKIIEEPLPFPWFGKVLFYSISTLCFMLPDLPRRPTALKLIHL